MATLLAHIKVQPGREAEFEEIARGLHESTFLKETGVRHYEYFRAAEESLYYCFLAFDDFNAFLVHQTSDYHEAASPKLGELVADLKLEWIDPVGGGSKLPPTNMQLLAEGASDLTKTYHKVFAATVQAWWEAQRSS